MARDSLASDSARQAGLDRPLRILMTNAVLTGRSGTETLVRDMVLALRRRGHSVTAFAPITGPAVAEIRATGSPVATSLASLEAPDIIHGHHTGPTIAALARFPGTPAIFVCHDFSSEIDAPPIHPRISRYLHVRSALRGRLVDECGIAASKVRFWPNTIDLQRVGPTARPPERLATAAIFAHPGTIPFTGMIAEACQRHGIAFRGELVGKAADDVVKRLSGTDLAFASGRMALEAMARGCAVINVDRFGVGGLVTTGRFAGFADVNFAYGALSGAASPELLDREIAAYSAEDAFAVTERVRRDFASDKGAEQLETTYRDVLAERPWPRREPNEDELAMAAIIERFLQQKRIYDRSFLRLREGLGPSEELQFQMGELASRAAELAEEVRRLRRGGVMRRLIDKLIGRTYRN
ncbi:glycosyltransferase [Aminobacter sp. LjRoot7]|uniref:glycosyltransferase n=1 Tax=Aminobacter sp. LjRoot7 TaxID=3342335 RepID=UPI003ECECDB9